MKIYSANFPCGKHSEPVFTFDHVLGGKSAKQSMKKFDEIKFVCKEEQSELHGFGGYFTARLYKDVFYSTNPETHTPGMHSWFPMYFPVKQPLYVKKN